METPQDRARHDDAGLDAVRFTWGGAYYLRFEAEWGHIAARRDGLGETIIAADPEALADLIAENFALHPVALRPAALSGGGS